MEHSFISLVCMHCGKSFDVPVYCGDRFCEICSVARRIRVRNRLQFLVDNVERLAGYNFKHLTLTIKNQDDLSRMCGSIINSFRNLRKTRSWRNHVSGGAFVVEVTGNVGSWHVHLHVIIQSKYYPFAEILKHWMRVSTGRGVYVQNIPKGQIVRYLTKYLSKCEVPDCDRFILNGALKGTRLFQPFGSWFAINKLYVKPPSACSNCAQPCLCFYSEAYHGENNFLMKDV